MDTAGFDRLSEQFERARHLSGREREEFLAKEADTDRELLAHLINLLAHHDVESPLDSKSPGLIAESLATSLAHADVDVPDHIGPYRVIRSIGEGGMGVVYEAEQESPQRRVALKIIKLGMDTKEVITRFEAERQVLAMMNHPSIAQVFDAGATEAGRPYFVMELVDGIQLLEYCDRKQLSMQDRLWLFVLVCEAIQHAHQKGIIHRDIKPSNVLVTMRNGLATPTIIDFGIAKATESKLANQTNLTQVGQVMGTPMYMAPEQADQGTAVVDTRSDLYSLGVILYELLTGTTPFESVDLGSRGYSEMLRVIRDQEPARPSTRYVVANEQSLKSAAARSSEIQQLRSVLRGDLDWIVMKCLEKSPDRRYGTASELAGDIKNYLTNLPVLARPRSTRYRMRKFVRRNRPLVVAGAAIMLTLLVGMVGTTTGWVRATDERGHAETARRAELAARIEAQVSAADAVREAETAEAIVAFLLNDLLGAADPARTELRDLTVREAVHIASENIEDKFESTPRIEARVRNTIAHTLSQLGAYREAEPHLRREWSLLVSLDGDSANGALVAQQALVTNLMQQSRFTDAIALAERQLTIIEDAVPRNDEMRLGALGNLGVAYLQLGRYAEATPILEDTLAAKRRLLGDQDGSTLTSIHNLAGLYGQLGEHERSLELSREAYAGRLETLGPGDPRTFGSLNLISWMLRTLERFDEVESLLIEAIASADDRLGPDHPTAVQLKKTLAIQFFQRSMFSEAEKIQRNVLRIQEKSDPELNNVNTISTMHNLASTLLQLDRIQEAGELYERLIAPARRIYPSDSREIAVILLKYGSALVRLERFHSAESVLLETFEIFDNGAARDANDRVDSCGALVDLYESWHTFDPSGGHGAAAERWLASARAAGEHDE